MKFLTVLSVYFLLSGFSFGQENRYNTFKLGIEPTFIYRLFEPGPRTEGYFGLRFEKEKALKKSPIFSNNFAIAWSRSPWGQSSMVINGQIITSSSSVLNEYYLKYYLSFYPLGKLFHSNHLQGIYIGLGPGLFTSTINKEKYRSGYGFYFVAGLQFYIKKRLSLTYEWEFYATRDITNAQVPQNNAGIKYLWSGSTILKIGWIFNKKKKE